MNIALTTIYGEVYEKDRIFDVTSCKIGENLLVPGIRLKEKMEKLGNRLHTADVYDFHEIQAILFMDLPNGSILTIRSFKDILKYVYRRKWKKDYLYKAVKQLSVEKRFLLLQEPPVVCPASYDPQFHKYFGKIITWNDELVDGLKYFKYFYPQVVPDRKYCVPFSSKKFLVMISGNKRSTGSHELYSERRKVIDYFEDKEDIFDLYGFGWEKEKLKNYKGTTNSKLDTLSGYKFSVCYENMCNVKGYITEKIFDCFFADCIPVYWGADNITEFIPENTFIDRTRFESVEIMYRYLENISEIEYEKYIVNIHNYLNSPAFFHSFSVEAYVNNMMKLFQN